MWVAALAANECGAHPEQGERPGPLCPGQAWAVVAGRTPKKALKLTSPLFGFFVELRQPLDSEVRIAKLVSYRTRRRIYPDSRHTTNLPRRTATSNFRGARGRHFAPGASHAAPPIWKREVWKEFSFAAQQRPADFNRRRASHAGIRVRAGHHELSDRLYVSDAAQRTFYFMRHPQRIGDMEKRNGAFATWNVSVPPRARAEAGGERLNQKR